MNSSRNILIITSSVDVTVDYIIEKYPSISFYRFNVDLFSQYKIKIGCSVEWEISSENWDIRISSKNIHSIYYRKPMFPDLNEFESAYWPMISKDIQTVITGLADSFRGTVLSRPYILRKTENKVFQLAYAIQNGLCIPYSCIGNDNDDLNLFSAGNSIIKPLSMGKVCTKEGCELYQTNMLRETDSDISLTPVYLQQYIQKSYEVRLTIINNHIFAVRIDCDDKTDWRRDYSSHQYSLIEVPSSVAKGCMNLLKDFGLAYGAFDFIVDQSRQWVFLELNPNGQWLWLEEALQLDISKYLVEYLLEGVE